MIVLDTNIVSEWIKPKPSTAVFEWLDERPDERLMITSITVAELHYGFNLGAVLDNLIMGYDGTDEEEPLKSS